MKNAILNLRSFALGIAIFSFGANVNDASENTSYSNHRSIGNRSQIPLAEAMRVIVNTRNNNLNQNARHVESNRNVSLLAEAMRVINSSRRRDAINRANQNAISNVRSNPITELERAGDMRVRTLIPNATSSRSEQLPLYDSMQPPAYELPPPYHE